MLAGGHLVVLRLGADAQLPQLLVQFRHKGLDPGADGAVIVVLHLLTLGGGRAEEGPAGEDQVGPFAIVLFVDKKILLLRPYGGGHPAHILAEETEYPDGLAAHRVHGAEQGGLFVQNFSVVGAEGGGDAQGIVLDKGVRGGVPGGIAPGLKGGPQSARGEGGGVRLALDQLLAREIHDD